jgi:riboflavin synthase
MLAVMKVAIGICCLHLFLLKTATSFSLKWPRNRLNSLSSQCRLDARMMFSGIVEDIGTVDCLTTNKNMILWDGSTGEGVELTVQSKLAIEDAYIGCSIAVNGVCLTVIKYDEEKFTVGLAPETLRRSNLGLVVPNSVVNVERALRADGRNSGHFVQGHVDGTGEILERWNEGDSLWIKMAVGQDLIKYIVPKGFICIDGTSLTICDVHTGQEGGGEDRSWFSIMLVRHTQENVIFPTRTVGDLVNIEVDVLAKMVETTTVAAAAVTQTEVQSLREEVKQLRADMEVMKSLLMKAQ